MRFGKRGGGGALEICGTSGGASRAVSSGRGSPTMRHIPILFTLAVGLAAPLIAADTPPPGRQRPTPEQMEAHHADMEAKRAADIALLLGLRADQKPGLDAFLKSMEPPHRHGRGEPGEGAPPPPPEAQGTLARLDHMSRDIDAHGAEAKQRIDTVRRFYASLTPEQQQRFDALERLKHEHGGMHHGPHGFGHEGPGGPDGPPPPPKS
jgi:periplasmic protein CpxP/Spy